MVSVGEAAHAYLLEAVAEAEDRGSRVWWQRCAWQDSDRNGHSFAYRVAINDDEAEEGFELVYHEGGRNDDVPPDFRDFTLFFGGGKFTPDVLWDHDAQPGAPLNTHSRSEVRTDSGTLLEFVGRWNYPDPCPDFLAGTYLCCNNCGTLVTAEDSGEAPQECICGDLIRDDIGAFKPLTETAWVVIYRVAGAVGDQLTTSRE